MKKHPMALQHKSILGSWRRSFMAAPCSALSGCGAAEKEKEPVVTVQMTPAARGADLAGGFRGSRGLSAGAGHRGTEDHFDDEKVSSAARHASEKRTIACGAGKRRLVRGGASRAKVTSSKPRPATPPPSVPSFPQQIQKAELDAAAAKSAFDAQQKVYDSRKELFQQGAIPRRDLDAAEVALLQARSQNEQAQKQLADLQRIGKEQALKSAHGSVVCRRKANIAAPKAQLSYSQIRSPIDGVVTDRPLYAGRSCHRQSADPDGHEYVEADRQGAHCAIGSRGFEGRQSRRAQSSGTGRTGQRPRQSGQPRA